MHEHLFEATEELRAEVKEETARFLPDSDYFEVDGVRVRKANPDYRKATERGYTEQRPWLIEDRYGRLQKLGSEGATAPSTPPAPAAATPDQQRTSPAE